MLWKNPSILIPKKQTGLEDVRKTATQRAGSTDLGKHQKPLITVHGCAENILLLETLIQNASKKHQHLNMVGTDIRTLYKARNVKTQSGYKNYRVHCRGILLCNKINLWRPEHCPEYQHPTWCKKRGPIISNFVQPCT